MRMYLISDNTDTLTGMRLAGVDGVIAKEKGTLEKALNEVLKDKNIGIILLTETIRVSGLDRPLSEALVGWREPLVGP